MRINSYLKRTCAPAVIVGLVMIGLASPGVGNAADLTEINLIDLSTCSVPQRPAACNIAPETQFACNIVYNFVPAIVSACEATVATANQVITFLNSQEYARATVPVQGQACNTVIDTSVGSVTNCLNVTAEVVYSGRAQSAVVVCQATMPGATTIAMKCNGAAGVAVIPTSIGFSAPIFNGAHGSAPVTATASGPLIPDTTVSFNINW